MTHFHPDHVGAAADLHALTGAPVHQGALDYAQCELVWGNPHWPQRIVDVVPASRRARRRHARARRAGLALRALHPLPARSRCSWSPARRSTAGSWSPRRVTPTASSACCATACCSPPTTCSTRSRRPWACGRPAGRTRSATTSTRSSGRSSSQPRIALPGHGEPIAEPVRRARELIAHHAERLDAAAALLTRRAAVRVRALARALRAGSQACGTPVRRRGDAVAPGAARARGSRGEARGRRERFLYFRLSGRRAATQYRRPATGASVFRATEP